MLVLGTLVFILALIYGVLVRWVAPGRAGAVLLQHAARVGGHRHPDRTDARAHRGGDQPLDVPGEVRAVAAHRDAARRAGQRHRHARAGAARARGAGGFAAHHARVDLPRRSRRFGLRAGRPRRPAARRRASTPSPTARSSNACAAPASSRIEGIERELAARRPVSNEEQESLQLMLRTLEQMNGSVALGFSSEDQLLGVLVIRDERLREAYSSDEIELFRGVATSIGITAAELAGLRADEGARSSRGARADGGRPRARDPQPAGIDQGRRPVPAAAATPRRRRARARASSSTSSSRR